MGPYGRRILLSACLAATIADFVQARPAAVEGDWLGTLAAAGASLRVAVHLQRADGGSLAGTFDSLDQAAMGLRIESVTFDGSILRFAMKVPLATFEGTFAADASRIEGHWMQGGASFPLTLTRGVAKAPNRPQEPKRPYPYLDEEVTYPNRSAAISLVGTLTLPRANAPVPAAILISGSGPEDRDETVFGHKPFLVLADHLTRNGIAVLRVDDRGVGGSSGDSGTATSEDFAGDVQAGIAFLKARREIDPARIGLVGHSEGGLIAPIVATRAAGVAFLVLIAGPGLPGDEILYLQGAALGKAGGASDAQIAAGRAVQERIFRIVKEEKETPALTVRLGELEQQLLAGVPAAQHDAARATLEAQLAAVSAPWFRYFLSHDPRSRLAEVRCPVLAINGELDLQVPYRPNLEAIGAALASGGNTNVTLLHPPGLNHLLQRATTGLPAEYAGIEETMAPEALDAIVKWIRKVVAVGP